MTTTDRVGTGDAAVRTFEQSRELGRIAAELTPGGVHSNVRLAEQPFPLFIESAEAGHVRDVDGNDLIDYVMGMGPMLLGHRPRRVLDAVADQLGRGIAYAAQHRLEIEVAELVLALIPCAERVRFNVTGTEAVQAAIRLARAATGRQRIVKFQGHYDGWADTVLVNVGRRGQDLGDGRLAPVPETLGAEAAVLDDLIVLEWNDEGALEAAFRDSGPSIAAVLMEPVMANNGVIPPRDGYLERARELCTKHAAVLIFDEVITGFRVAAGGAQQRLGVTPDLATFGKALASGFPVAAVAGRRDLFEPIADGRIMHAGTFNALPVGLAAAAATLGILTDPAERVYEQLEERGGRLHEGLRQIAHSHPSAVLVQGLPMLFCTAFTDEPAMRDHAAVARSDAAALRAFLPYLLAEGVRLPAKGVWFVSAAHTDDDIDRTIDAFDRALAAFERAR